MGDASLQTDLGRVLVTGGSGFVGANLVTALLDRTRELAKDGKLEQFKTTREHDGTVEHPEWLESA